MRRYDGLGRGFPVLLALGWVVLSAAGVVGCAPAQPVEAPTESRAQTLLARAQAHAGAGRSLQAEQYYIAALDEGADPWEVYPPLVDSCLSTGRFRRALDHVDAELRLFPEHRPLQELRTSLREALGLTQQQTAEAQSAVEVQKTAEAQGAVEMQGAIELPVLIP